MVVILAGLAMRWFNLDFRAVHHDESLHALYGKYYFNSPSTKYYKYEPLMHGPFLYHAVAWFYSLFGISIESARYVAAFFGSIFLFIPMMFSRHLTKASLILITGLIAFSPSLVYWSRFIRNDIMVLALLFILYALALTKERKVTWLVAPFVISLHWCMKENIYMHFVIIGAFFLWKFILEKAGKTQRSLPMMKWDNTMYFRFALVCLASVFLYCYFYTGVFRYSEGILDGLFRKSLSYWWNQHKVNRIPGPLVFQSLVLFLYEPVLITGILLTTFHWLFTTNKIFRLSFAGVLMLSLILHLTQKSTYPIPGSSWMQVIKPFDYYFFFCYLGLGLLMTTDLLMKGKNNLAFLAYAFFSLLFSYSYVGEKVPWLSSYPLLFGLLLVVFYLNEHRSLMQKPSVVIALTLAILFQIHLSVSLNFRRAGDQYELISQVHTTKEFETTMNAIAGRMDEDINAYQTLVYNASDSQWPVSWYLYGKSGYRFDKIKSERIPFYDFVIADQFNPDLEVLLGETHVPREISLRHHWLPDYNKMTLNQAFKTLFTRKGWNASGDKKLVLWVRRSPDLEK